MDEEAFEPVEPEPEGRGGDEASSDVHTPLPPEEAMAEEGPEEAPALRGRHWGSAMAVPAVLLIVVTLLAIGMLRREEGRAPRPTPVPVTPAATTFLFCSDCHADLDRSLREHPVLRFTHERHFAIGVSDCAVCHVANTHEPDRTNRPTMVTCFQCHSLEEGGRAPGTCTLCHPKDLDPSPRTHRAADWLPVRHGDAALADPFVCATCHQQRSCRSCHGLELPHPSGFDERPHAERFFQDPALCDRCHPRAPLVERDACDRCHHPQGPETSTWIDWHPEVVRNRGAATCFRCHADQTCRTCHRQGPERFTDDDLAADRALLLASPQPSAGAEGG